MEIRILVGDPIEKSPYLRMAAQGVRAGEVPRQLLVAEGRVDGAMTDRVDRLGMPPAAAARHRVMPFDAKPQRAAAQEAG